MSTTYTITLSTREVANPLHGIPCFASRCDELVTRFTFGGSAAYCEQHARGQGELIPPTRLLHVVELDDGSTFEGWTLALALEQLSEHITGAVA